MAQGSGRPVYTHQLIGSPFNSPAPFSSAASGSSLNIAEQLLAKRFGLNYGKIRGTLQGLMTQAGCCIPGGVDPGCAIRSGRMNGMRRNPNIPDLNIVFQNQLVGAGVPIVANFVANATARGVAAPWNVAGNRQYLLGQNNPRGLDGFYQNMWLTSVNPVLEVTIAENGGVINKDASEEATAFFQGNFGFFVDPNGTGTNLSVDATLIEDFPLGGLGLSSDQVFQYSERSLCRFDQLGVGEYANWAVLGDLQLPIQCQMTVRAGVKANFATTNPYAPGGGFTVNERMIPQGGSGPDGTMTAVSRPYPLYNR